MEKATDYQKEFLEVFKKLYLHVKQRSGTVQSGQGR